MRLCVPSSTALSFFVWWVAVAPTKYARELSDVIESLLRCVNFSVNV
jgi:hypothetical protein